MACGAERDEVGEIAIVVVIVSVVNLDNRLIAIISAVGTRQRPKGFHLLSVYAVATMPTRIVGAS